MPSTITLEGAKYCVFYKGRVAFYGILKSMGVGAGDEVVLPAYTCVVVPNAVLYLGATPRYVDIGLSTFSVEPRDAITAIGGRTKAVICQNTYGLSYGVDEISAACKARNVRTIEDCTHGFGGSYKGRPNGSWCDAAFFSSQWNKPFSTGLGGYAIAKDPALESTLSDFAASLPLPILKNRAMLSILLRVRPLISPSTYYAFVDAYRYLSKRNLVTGSSSGEELEGLEMPEGYLSGMSGVQAKAAIRALRRLPVIAALRKANGALYTARLQEMGKNHVPPELHGDHLYLKYPLLVEDRKAFMAKAREARIPLGDWFISPLHPIEQDFSPWSFDPAQYPNAVYAAAHVVNLPTDTVKPQKVLDFLEKNLDLILPEKG
jgi:Predicted pyridoxal phosphate-dependent enzyme apparently involved in regulation of cell wall biogenesis